MGPRIPFKLALGEAQGRVGGGGDRTLPKERDLLQQAPVPTGNGAKGSMSPPPRPSGGDMVTYISTFRFQ